MNYKFTAILIFLLCLLAVFLRPEGNSLNIDSENIIIPLPKPKHE